MWLKTFSQFFSAFSCVANFLETKDKLRDDVYQLDASIKHLNEKSLTDVLFYDSDRFNDSKNKQILFHTIWYIQATKRFERPLNWPVLIFVQLLPLCFSLICLFKLYLQCNLLSYYFNLFTDFSFSKGCIGDISYYVQHFTISVFVWGECWVMFCLRFY